MERILLTGGAGFIGGYLVDELAGRYDLVVLDALSEQVHGTEPVASELFARIKGKCDFVHGSVTDPGAVAHAMDGVDRVIHLAAETGTGQSMYELRRYTDVNLLGLATVFEEIGRAGSRVKQVVLPSSRSVYGEGKYSCAVHGDVYPSARTVRDMKSGDFAVKCPVCESDVTLVPTDEDSALHPSSFYAYTKMSQEDMLRQFGSAMGIPFTILRYQNVYGAGQSLQNPYTGLLSILSRQFVAGEPINVYEDGSEGRDFVYVTDVARLTAACVANEATFGQTLNIGSGEHRTILEVAEALRSAYGSESPIRISGDFRKGDIKGNVADMTRTRAALGDAARVSFAEGMSLLAEWVKGVAPAGAPDLLRSLRELDRAGILFRGEPQ